MPDRCDEAVDVRQLSAADLARYYQSLPPATALPVGRFEGWAWSHDLLWMSLFSAYAWDGKEFKDDRVLNIVFGEPLKNLKGYVTLETGEPVIDYPQLGLKDYLKPISATRWLGYMPLGTSRVWFTLQAER